MILPQTFYAQETVRVAKHLLGCYLVHLEGEATTLGRIVETEAYLVNDPASHAFIGQTPRNSVMFGPVGHAYVYFIYGVHYCLNFSCMPEGQAGCVLLRAIEPLEGLEQMAEARGLDPERLRSISGLRMLTSGPGRVCQALDITRKRLNGEKLYTADSPLKIVDDGWRPGEIRETLRIGITKSHEMPLRYLIAGNAFVSGKKVG